MGIRQSHGRHGRRHGPARLRRGAGQASSVKASGVRRQREAAAVVVHRLAHARAALKAASSLSKAVRLFSPPGAAGYLGAGYFRAMIAEAAAEFPRARFRAVLDCGDEAGTALGALREGVRFVSAELPPAVRRKLAAIARKCGGALVAAPSRALDLAETADPEAATREWLRRGSAQRQKHVLD